MGYHRMFKQLIVVVQSYLQIVFVDHLVLAGIRQNDFIVHLQSQVVVGGSSVVKQVMRVLEIMLMKFFAVVKKSFPSQ